MSAAGLLARRIRSSDDDGSAIVEFVFVAVVMLVPLIYLIAAVAVAQRTNLAVSTAAREAGRAYATSDTSAQARRRAEAAVRLALADQGIGAAQTELRYTRATGDCDGRRVAPALEPGTEFAVCVIRRVQLPGVPSVLAGQGIRSVGRYVVHVDDFREAPDD